MKMKSFFLASLVLASFSLLPCGNIWASSSSQQSERIAANVDGLPGALIRPIIDLVYPVGSLFLDGTGKLKPPGQGYGGIVWTEQVGAQGHVLMGYSMSGNWAVGIGNIQGTLQTTDPHMLTQAELPAYDLPTAPASPIVYTSGAHGSTGGGPQDVTTLRVSSGGSNQPHVHELSGIARFGVKIWKRTS